MKSRFSAVTAALTAMTGLAQAQAEQNWGQWRGPLANGVAPAGDPPIQWSEQKNIRWKVEIPGHGLSTPIVWGDMVFVQTAVPANPPRPPDDAQDQPGAARPQRDGDRPGPEADRPASGERRDAERPNQGPQGEGNRPREGRSGRGMRQPPPSDPYRFTLLALERSTGKTIWKKALREQVPHEGSHQDGSLAPASPATDGEHVFAYFGSRGLYCLTMDGDPVWEKDLGDMQTRNGFGEGSSPVLHGDTVVVNWDHEGDSFIVALDKKSGNEKWRKSRDEVTSWSTPLIISDSGREQVVVSATNRVRSYDLNTGDVIWECGGLGANCAPTPVAHGGTLFAMSGYRDDALLAIKYAGANGDLTGSESIAWKLDKATPYVPSPLLYGDTLYFLQKNTGILSSHDPVSGKAYFSQQRLEDITGVYASPVGAADRVYIAGRNGATCVLKRGPSFEVLAVNNLDDEFSASPAIAGKELFLRGIKHLYCVAE